MDTAVLDKIGLTAGHKNVSSTERWLSIAAGAGLAGCALMGRSPTRRIACGAAGAALLYRGLSGFCSLYSALGMNTAPQRGGVASGAGVKVEEEIEIERDVEQVFRVWRDFSNLPRFMGHLRSVEPIGETRSRWVADGMMGTTVEWEAEIHNERENELIAWRSIAGSTVDTAGSVHFQPVGDGRTRVRVSLKYNPPLGKAGATIARWMGQGAGSKIAADLKELKRMLEEEPVSSTGAALLGGSPVESTGPAASRGLKGGLGSTPENAPIRHEPTTGATSD